MSNVFVVHKNGRCIIDAGCKEGRRSRVGWGPKMTLAHNGKHSVFDSGILTTLLVIFTV